MTSNTAHTSFYDKTQAFSSPLRAFQSPVHVDFLTSQIKNLHGKLESRLYSYLNPKTAKISETLLCAIPASLLLKSLSGSHMAAFSVAGSAYLWSSKEDIASKQAKVDLLHSLAIGFFANMFNLSNELSFNNFTKLPVNTALLTATLFIANQIESNSESI